MHCDLITCCKRSGCDYVRSCPALTNCLFWGTHSRSVWDPPLLQCVEPSSSDEFKCWLRSCGPVQSKVRAKLRAKVRAAKGKQPPAQRWQSMAPASLAYPPPPLCTSRSPCNELQTDAVAAMAVNGDCVVSIPTPSPCTSRSPCNEPQTAAGAAIVVRGDRVICLPNSLPLSAAVSYPPPHCCDERGRLSCRVVSIHPPNPIPPLCRSFLRTAVISPVGSASAVPAAT